MSAFDPGADIDHCKSQHEKPQFRTGRRDEQGQHGRFELNAAHSTGLSWLLSDPRCISAVPGPTLADCLTNSKHGPKPPCPYAISQPNPQVRFDKKRSELGSLDDTSTLQWPYSDSSTR